MCLFYCYLSSLTNLNAARWIFPQTVQDFASNLAVHLRPAAGRQAETRIVRLVRNLSLQELRPPSNVYPVVFTLCAKPSIDSLGWMFSFHSRTFSFHL